MKRTWMFATVMALASLAFAGQAARYLPAPQPVHPAPQPVRGVAVVYYPPATQIVAMYQIDGVGYPVDCLWQGWEQNLDTGQWSVFAVIVSGSDGEFAVYSDGSQTLAFRVQ